MFKINISDKSGKTYKLEAEAPELLGKELNDKISGHDVSSDLEGYEFEVKGLSDKSGFPALEQVGGVGLKKVLLGYGKSMKKKPRREGKKKLRRPNPDGLRLKKTVRGKTISEAIIQINLKTIKHGKRKLEDIFPEQNKGKEAEVKAE
jgi:small subunit ribosomal protein S6e